VHIFVSFLDYLFPAPIYNEICSYRGVAITSTIEIIKDIMVVFVARGKEATEELNFKSEMKEETARIPKPDQVMKEWLTRSVGEQSLSNHHFGHSTKIYFM